MKQGFLECYGYENFEETNKGDGGPWGSTHGERRRGLTPFILLPRTLHLPAPPLLAPRCAAKLWRLRRQSSIRRPAPLSLVVSGGVCEVRRAMKEKNGASLSPVLFQLTKTSSSPKRMMSLFERNNGPSSDINWLLDCHIGFFMIVLILLVRMLSFTINRDFIQKIAVPAKISRFRLIHPRFMKKSATLANNRLIQLVSF